MVKTIIYDDNPFFFGYPVTRDSFIGRKSEIRRVVNLIKNKGQSAAIVGQPRSGKTSFLQYLAEVENRQIFFGENTEKLLFSFLDSHTFTHNFKQSDFWEVALQPLHEKLSESKDSPVFQAYKMCEENNFSTFELAKLLKHMSQDGWRLVLIVDEFDGLLLHPILNSGEFFGSMRSLVSRSEGAISLIIATNSLLTTLNRATQAYSQLGSPYFNFLQDIALGPFQDKDLADLLANGSNYFTKEDRQFIKYICGNHPYLSQVAASALWDSYENDDRDCVQRRTYVIEEVYNAASQTLSITWEYFLPTTRKVLTAVSLAHLDVFLERESILSDSYFDISSLTESVRDLKKEFRQLRQQGYIQTDENIVGGWRIRPAIFLWWIGEEIHRTVSKDLPFHEWLTEQQWGFFLKNGEKKKLEKNLKVVGELLEKGVSTLIESAAKGLIGKMS